MVGAATNVLSILLTGAAAKSCRPPSTVRRWPPPIGTTIPLARLWLLIGSKSWTGHMATEIVNKLSQIVEVDHVPGLSVLDRATPYAVRGLILGPLTPQLQHKYVELLVQVPIPDLAPAWLLTTRAHVTERHHNAVQGIRNKRGYWPKSTDQPTPVFTRSLACARTCTAPRIAAGHVLHRSS
jgi:hypothetical protein